MYTWFIVIDIRAVLCYLETGLGMSTAYILFLLDFWSRIHSIQEKMHYLVCTIYFDIQYMVANQQINKEYSEFTIFDYIVLK